MVRMMGRLWNISDELVPWVTFGASLVLLGGAHAFEHWGGLLPCALCLTQRDAHWVAIIISLFLILTQKQSTWRVNRLPLFALLAVAYLVGAGIAVYHAGVEWKWWAGPAACSAAGAGPVNVDDLLNALGQAAAGPSCDEIPWSLFGISMAGYNALLSLGLALSSSLPLLKVLKKQPHE